MIGARCTIVGTDIVGLVVGKTTYVGDQDRYAVRYLAGGPQERWLTAGEITFDQKQTNVVAMRGGRNREENAHAA